MEEKNAGRETLKRRIGNGEPDPWDQPQPEGTEALQPEGQNASGMETQALSRRDFIPGLEQIQEEVDQSHGRFQIKKYTLLLHTDEKV